MTLTEQLNYIAIQRKLLDEEELAAADTGRRDGLTWRQLADAWHIGSSQGAQQRYSRLYWRVKQARVDHDAHQSASHPR